MNVLMISRSAYEWDIRVRREARALSEAGHDVTFLGLPTSPIRDGDIEVIAIDEPRARPISSERRKSAMYRGFRWILLPEYRSAMERTFQREVLNTFHDLALEPDVIHAHDFPALVPAFEIAGFIDCRVVYDSHEIWAGRPRRGRPEPLRRRKQLHLERDLARQAAAVIMVSDHGAEHLEASLGLKNVHVVRNTFPIESHLHPPSRPKGALYAGRIAPLRDLETVFSASVWHEENLELHLMGELDEVAPPQWAQTHPKASMDEVNLRLADLGIGLATMTDRYLNHLVALPNKLFQSVSVGVPVVATRAPQIKEVVEAHDLGELYRAGDPDSLDAAVRRVLSRYAELTENVRVAQSEFDWSVDAARLVDLYRDLDPTSRG